MESPIFYMCGESKLPPDDVQGNPSSTKFFLGSDISQGTPKKICIASTLENYN
jgi:hypothetical protein